MPLSSRWIRFGWFVTGIVGIAVICLMAVREHSQAEANAWVNHTLEILGNLQEVKSDLRGASNELRGYVMTQQPAWLEAYRRHLGLGAQTVARTQVLVQDNPLEFERSERLADEIKSYGVWGEDLLDIFKNKGLAAATAAIATGRGETEQQTLDTLANVMLHDERALLATRQQVSARLRRTALWLELALGALVCAQVAASGMLVRSRYKSFEREQETLRLAQRYSEAIVATIRQPLVVLDSFLRVVSANRAFYELFQTRPDRTEGLPFTEIGAGMWNIPELVAHLHSVIDEHEQIDRFHLLHPFLHIGTRQLVLSARKVYQPGVRTGLLLLAIEDETERVKSEQRLEQINAELQGFAYSVAHDLRAPLRGMQGFSDALREDYGDQLDETGRNYTVRIAAAARRMDELIRDLLDYSRLARSELPLGPVEFSQVVAAAKQQLMGVLTESGASLVVAGDLPRVSGHFGTLVQVLANLIGNSAKFVPPGVTPLITIRSENRGTVHRICVEDNGIGIPAQFHDKIFRVFERLHPPEEYPGTGIGLAVVRKGIERLGGKVGVESALGKGACFWIELSPAADPTR